MLILRRKKDEGLVLVIPGIAEPVEIIVTRTGKGHASLGVRAPKTVNVLRSELYAQVKQGDAALDEILKTLIPDEQRQPAG